MRKKFMLPMLVFWVITSTSAAASGRDGAWWSQLDATQKNFYIAGLTDGVIVGLGTITMSCYAEDDSFKDGTQNCIDEYVNAFSPGYNRLGYARREPASIVAGIDALYSDYRNINIPVSSAISQVLRGMNGESNLEEVIERLRRFN